MDAAKRERVRATLALARVPGIGSVFFRRLLESFGDPAAVFTKTLEELAAVPGIGEERARALAAFDGWKQVDAEMDRAEASGLALVGWGEVDYPEPLAAVYDAPPVFYYKGELNRMSPPAVAVVGTRRPSDYGERATAFIVEALAEAGMTVVSGMARGIDTFAHRATLKAGAPTVAVLGCGADVVYPPENKKLYEEICEKGVVVSEFPPSARPEAKNFPRRNRIISGLSAGVLVVEAGDRSGALITGYHAAEQGREVFAVPGSIFSPMSDGCRRLIAGGAKAVGSAEEILEELALQFSRPSGRQPERPAADLSALDVDERNLLNCVPAEATPADEVAARLGWDPSRVAAALLSLEIAGLVEKLPGNNYRRIFM